MDFSEQLPDFEKWDAAVTGISPDSPASHQKFVAKHQLRVLLLSDENHEVAEKYDVWKLKRTFGKEYHGIERSTFLITPEGKLAQAWRKVKVNGHVDAVKTLEALREQKLVVFNLTDSDMHSLVVVANKRGQRSRADRNRVRLHRIYL
jgi:peroxiredoxin Q/BCP